MKDVMNRRAGAAIYITRISGLNDPDALARSVKGKAEALLRVGKSEFKRRDRFEFLWNIVFGLDKELPVLNIKAQRHIRFRSARVLSGESFKLGGGDNLRIRCGCLAGLQLGPGKCLH